MKKLALALLAVATLQVSAQEKPKVVSAVIALRGNELEEAKAFIDEATEIIDGKNPSEINEKIMSKFHYNKAQIYSKIAASPDAEIKALAENANDVAAQSIIDLLIFESKAKKQPYSEKAVVEDIPMIAYNYLVQAGSDYEKGDYEGAYNGYMNAFELKKNEVLGDRAQLDTSLLFNAAIIANAAGDVDASIAAFKQCLDLGYKGITYVATYVANGQPKQYPTRTQMEKEIEMGLAENPVIGEDQTTPIYISLINAYKKKGDMEAYNAILAEARAKFPENKDLLDIQLQSYLDEKDYDGALANLDEAIAKNPTQAIYHFVKGTILQTELKDLDNALVEYKAALELDDKLSDAMYMCGLVYVDKANLLSEQMNNLGLREVTKFEKLKAEQKTIFEESVQYFEKALEMKPEDEDTMRALMEVYRKTGDYQKSMDMKNRLEGM